MSQNDRALHVFLSMIADLIQQREAISSVLAQDPEDLQLYVHDCIVAEVERASPPLTDEETARLWEYHSRLDEIFESRRYRLM